MCRAKFVKKIKIHISHLVTLFRISCCDNAKKYTRAGQVTDDNMAHTHLTFEFQRVQTHIHGVCNNSCFSTASIAARTLRNVMLDVHCLFEGYLTVHLPHEIK